MTVTRRKMVGGLVAAAVPLAGCSSREPATEIPTPTPEPEKEDGNCSGGCEKIEKITIDKEGGPLVYWRDVTVIFEEPVTGIVTFDYDFAVGAERRVKYVKESRVTKDRIEGVPTRIEIKFNED